MEIIFFNGCGNGDLHYSREFVKDIMENFYEDRHFYVHKKSKRIFKDLNLSQDKNDNILDDPNHQFYTVRDLIHIKYIHTWIGQQFMKYHCIKQCSLYSNYELYKDIYQELNIPIKDIEYYIPSINYNVFDIKNIDNYINKNKRRKILITNGSIISGQSVDFDFELLLEKIYKLYPDFDFIFTYNKHNIQENNVKYTEDIIKSEHDSDLNEISYLSTFCDLIIGRASGPYCFTHVKENMFNENKTYISFCDNYYEGVFYETNKCENIWSDNYDSSNILSIIQNKLDT